MKQNLKCRICILSLLINSIVPYLGLLILVISACVDICLSLDTYRDKQRFRVLLNDNSIVFISIAYLILLTTKSPSPSLHSLGIFIYVSGLLIYNYVSGIVNTDSLLKYFTIGNIIVAIGGLVQYYLISNAIPASWIDSRLYGTITMRAFGVMQNPNILAGYLAMCIAVYMQSIEDIKGNTLGFVALVLSSYTMILTYSRGGWITVLLIAIIYGLIKRKRSYFGYIAAFLLGIALLKGGLERIDITNSISDNSIKYRFEIYIAALNMIKENLITGVGLFGTSRVLQNYSQVIVATVYHPHNLILFFMAETGLIGLFLVLLMAKRYLKGLFEIGLYRVTNDKMALAYLMGLLTICIHGMIDAVALSPQFLFYIIFIMSLFQKRLNTLKCGEDGTTKMEAYIHGRRIQKNY